MEIYTVGHSDRTKEELLQLLHEHDIEVLADVRGKWPYSRRSPHFNKGELQEWVPAEGHVEYTHIPKLGGWQPKQGIDPAVNGGWQKQGFRNYADYTLSDAFMEGVRELEGIARTHRTAYMCAEAVPWRCHRLILSNVMVHRVWEVRHIINFGGKYTVHELGKWGATPDFNEAGRLIYPAAS